MHSRKILYILLVIWSSDLCRTERVIVKLANGGTTRPLLILPLQREPDANPEILLPVANALQADDPFDLPDNNKSTDTITIPENGEQIEPPTEETTQSDSEAGENTNTDGESGDLLPMTISEEAKPTPSTKITTTTTAITTSTTTRTTSSTTTEVKTTKPLSATPEVLPTLPSIPVSSNSPPTISPCHQSCLEALNTTRLYSNHSLTIPRGSDLTLICELPLPPEIYVENLIWLFQSTNIPEDQCSLTKQEFLSSCSGFSAITDIDDRNATFLREVLTMSNLLDNHMGQYMCQIKVTCCQGSTEHPMSQELIVSATVSMRWADYTVDLAVAGSLAAGLLVLLVLVTIYLDRRREKAYKALDEKVMHSTPSSTVLHLPLIEDDDDSFDSDLDS